MSVDGLKSIKDAVLVPEINLQCTKTQHCYYAIRSQIQRQKEKKWTGAATLGCSRNP